MTLQCPANFLHFLQSENIGSPDGNPVNKLSYWNSRQQIPNCHINSEIKGNIYKLFDKLWHWKLQKVTGNSMLRTYEKFGNTLVDGLRGEGGGGGDGWFVPILVRKGDYFLILCKNFIPKF